MAEDSSNTKKIVILLEEEEEEVNRGLFDHFKGKGEDVVGIVPSDPLVAEAEGVASSYLSAEYAAVQPLDDQKSLLILMVQCHPGPGYRYKDATITWKFKPRTESKPAFEPKIVLHAPRHSIGGWTEETDMLKWGIAVSASGGFGGASLGLTPSREKAVEKITQHAMTIRGTARGKGTYCVWTIAENESSEAGIPSHFQLAVVVHHDGPFLTDLDVRATLQGSYMARSLRARQGDNSSLLRKIDVEGWKGAKLVCGRTEKEWREYMEGITGEVPGVIVEFAQKIVSN